MAARERKLLLHEKVEVRSTDDGFVGSWHPAVVTGCKELVREVEYDYILCDDGSAKLVEDVTVTTAIDGVLDKEVKRVGEYRGLIRPSPESPTLGVAGARSLHYGTCVDLFYDEAWWEGVVFDHEDGCKTRRIFFPDLGDELEGRVDDLRFSKDWDEVTEEWTSRGNWLFLEVIEELEQDWPLIVSVKQMWYDVRTTDDFEELGEWTSSKRDVWKELIRQVFLDHVRFSLKQIFGDVNSSCRSAKPGHTLLKFSEKAFESVLKSEGPFRSSPAAAAPFEAFQSDDEGILRTDVNHRSSNQVQIPISVRPMNEQISFPNPDEDSGVGSSNYDESPSLKLSRGKHKKSTMVGSHGWQSAVPLLIPGPRHHPDAIDEYKKCLESNTTSKVVVLDVSKHLLYLGWKIEFSRRNGLRKRYISPGGKYFYSLPQVLKMFDHGVENSVSSYEETLSPPGKSQASSELSKSCITDEKLHIEPEYCPEAVRDYSLLTSCSAELKLKGVEAKKHLSAIGWSFYYHGKGSRRDKHYISPTGTVFHSLLSACRWCVEASALTLINFSPAMGRVINRDLVNNYDGDLSSSKSPLPLVAVDSIGNLPLIENGMFANAQLSDMPMSEGFVQSSEGEVHKTRMSRKKRRKHGSDCLEVSLSPKRGRKSSASMRLRADSNADSSTPMRRTSKRVRERVASSAQQIPRTILSWLIDNNVVLPREKVQYRSSKNGPRMAEGRISREGIKCSCCRKIFTLGNFEAHAGSSSDLRPSANIFLEDGRSLLECQLQLKQRNSSRKSRLERQPKATQHKSKSDYICSVCHYGGELVLCDLCPSSFHTRCVGLKEVPDGDWFCPSCCCQICNKSGSNTRNRPDKDSSFLICCQCERRYHAECVTNKGGANSHSERYWFCHNTCRQIFYGLRGIMGEKFPVGTENMTWTLVKYMESESSKNNASDDECLVECYSKLNVALSVMHECFEPVKEPRTRRDLMEDVIFNRWSDLNRLNFQGFYTVLLEKNDELISAATVRIYGKTVAEVPLVATRFQYRRLGMCRILMNELEKQLAELGVERLVLPAIPSVLNAWITSFGFSKMDESERLNFLAYTFLDFQGTVFCQKMLKIDLSMVLSLPAEKQTNSYDHVNNNFDIGVDGNSAVSEVFEGKQVEETDIVEQELTCINVAGNDEAGCSAAKPIMVVDEPASPGYSSLQPALDYPLLATSNGSRQSGNREAMLKCYKRRKISAC